MKRWVKVVVSAVLAVVLILGTVIGGYAAFVNRKVDSADVTNLKQYEDIALGANVFNSEKKETSKMTDGKKSTGLTLHEGESIYLEFSEPVTADTIVLRETLNKGGSLAYALEGGTKQFSIYASLNGKEEMIYRNDKIDTYRMCTFPETTFDALRIEIDGCRGSAKLNEVSVYNVGKTEKEFRVNDYFVYGEGADCVNNKQFLTNLDHITDLTMFIGVSLDENGEIVYTPDKETFIRSLADVRAAIGDRDIKLYCEIGIDAEDKGGFIAKYSKKIAENLAAFTLEHDFDGVDFDWEYPSGSKDWDAYNQLALDLHEELSKVGKKFSFAVAVWNMRFSDEAKEAVDYFNVMIYDHITDDRDGYHSTFKETTLAIERLIYQGYDKEKICLGLPYYGRNVRDSDQEGNYWINYDKSNITDPWTNYSEKGVHTNGETGEETIRKAYFNGYAMIRDKTAYAVAMELGGIMTWHGMSDIPVDNELSLHKAVTEAIGERLETPSN